MRKAVFIIFLMVSFVGIKAQNAKALFDSIPDAMLPLLSSVNRADFVDFLESDMKAEVKNKFSGTSEMTDLTEDYIRIKMTERSTWEMKALPLNDSTKVICVVSTACGPVCDSEVRFYTTDWKEVPASSYITLPVVDDYFQLTDSSRLDDYTHYRSRMDMLLAKASLSKDDNTLTFTFTTPEYRGDYNAEDEEEIANANAFLRGPRVYTWGYDAGKGGYYFSSSK